MLIATVEGSDQYPGAFCAVTLTLEKEDIMKANTKAATKAASKKIAKKEVAPLAAAAIAAIAKEMKREDISNCEAVRNVAKKFKTVGRGQLREHLVKQYKMNAGTVNRQIQDGRAAA